MKFMLSLREDQGKELQRVANKRRVTLQELIRAVIIPEWKELNGNSRHNGERVLGTGSVAGATPEPITSPGSPPNMIEKKAKQE